MIMSIFYIIIIIVRYGCLLLSQAFSPRYFSWINCDLHRLGFKFHTAVLSVLCVMFRVYYYYYITFEKAWWLAFSFLEGRKKEFSTLPLNLTSVYHPPLSELLIASQNIPPTVHFTPVLECRKILNAYIFNRRGIT